MNSNNYLRAFVSLGRWMMDELYNNESLLLKAYYHNRFFTVDNLKHAIASIARYYLDEDKLLRWLRSYDIEENGVSKRIGIVMAGNIPLVGFHDLLCVVISGHTAVIKLSARDKILLPEITAQLIRIEPRIEQQIIYADMLKSIDAVIATGSNSSYHYFAYYFGKYPHIIRMNRHSVAVLTGRETIDQLKLLGNDVFRYFGLGCRNVSMLLVPEYYSFDKLNEAWTSYKSLMEEEVYKNNFDYHYTMLLMNQIPHVSTGYVLFREHDQPASPVACLHYKKYHSLAEAIDYINRYRNQIQCIVTAEPLEHAVPFGATQQPELWDYADGIDTLHFLIDLRQKMPAI